MTSRGMTGARALALAGTIASLLSFVGGYVATLRPEIGAFLLGSAGLTMFAGNVFVLVRRKP